MTIPNCKEDWIMRFYLLLALCLFFEIMCLGREGRILLLKGKHTMGVSFFAVVNGMINQDTEHKKR